MHRSQWLWACVAVVAVVGLAFEASAAGAANGGNTKTMACKGTGYLDWLRADGSAFAGPRDCHSYAVHGGVMLHKVTPGPLLSWEQTCAQLGGSFSTEVQNGETIWDCTWGALVKNGGILPEWQFDGAVDALLSPVCPVRLIFNTFASTGPGDLGYALMQCDPGIPG